MQLQAGITHLCMSRPHSAVCLASSTCVTTRPLLLWRLLAPSALQPRRKLIPHQLQQPQLLREAVAPPAAADPAHQRTLVFVPLMPTGIVRAYHTALSAEDAIKATIPCLEKPPPSFEACVQLGAYEFLGRSASEQAGTSHCAQVLHIPGTLTTALKVASCAVIGCRDCHLDNC